MYKEYNLNKYCLVDSIIHRLNPILKIISVILFVIGIFFINNVVEVLLSLIYILTCILWSNISIKLYLKKIYLFRYILALIFIFNIIIGINILSNLLVIYKIIILIIYIDILIFTTPQFEIIYGLESILNPLNKKVNIKLLVFNFSLILRFFAIYQEQVERISIAISLKGVISKKDHLKNKLNITISSLKFSFNKIKILREVMYVKLYNYGVARNNYRYNKFNKRDLFILAINICMIILLVRKR